MTAQIIDRFPLILGFASMKAKDCWNGHPNRPVPRPGHCKKGLLAGWPLGIGLSEKWVPQNRWKTSFLGHDLEKKTFWTNLVSENSWQSFIVVPSRLEFPDVKPIVIQWLLLSPYIWWNRLSKILVTNMCASFYTISNSECKLSRTPQFRMFLFSEFTTENIAA